MKKKNVFKRITKRITAVLLVCTLCLSQFAGCKKEAAPEGNVKTLSGTLKPGDTYAKIKLKGYDGELTFVLFGDIAPQAVKHFTQAANSKYYDGKSIHRVLQGSLIQGGALNLDGSDNTIPPEELFDIEPNDNARNFFGALGFANDPETKKNYRQFYVVTADQPVDIAKQEEGYKNVAENAEDGDFPEEELDGYVKTYEMLEKMPDAVKERYEQKGGLPLLDGNVTVFGQLVTGWELLAAVSSADVVAGNGIDDQNPALGDGKGQKSRPAEIILIESVEIITIPLEVEETKKSKKK